MPNTEDIRVPADYLENSWKEPSESEEGKVVYENMITLRDIESASEMEDTDLQVTSNRSSRKNRCSSVEIFGLIFRAYMREPAKLPWLPEWHDQWDSAK